MQGELRRSNSIGDSKGIQHFACTALKNGEIKLEAARQICSFINGIRLNFNSAVAFFEYLGFADVTDTTLTPTDRGVKLHSLLNQGFEEMLCEVCFNKIVEDGIIRLDALRFDTTSGCYYIQKHGFPLDSAVFRNILIQLGALKGQNDGSFQLTEGYEDLFAKASKIAKRKLSLEALREQLARQSEQGEAAEFFALEYEQIRLVGVPNSRKIKRISDIDVTAGYDIVSFESNDSQGYDRFIEVKSFSGKPQFFWSQNEIETASSLGDKYYIYLVDIEKMTDGNYHPVVIRNPAETVLRSEDWLMQPTAHKVLPTGNLERYL